jgi:hypothetical protein
MVVAEQLLDASSERAASESKKMKRIATNKAVVDAWFIFSDAKVPAKQYWQR